MKRAFSYIVLLLCLCAMPASAFQLISEKPPAGDGVTYLFELKLEDDADDLLVWNTSTSANDFTASAWTSGLFTTTAKEGSRAFRSDAGTEFVVGDDTNLPEKFALTFWWRPDNHDATQYENLFQIGDGGTSDVISALSAWRHSTYGDAAEIRFFTRGATGSACTNDTTDIAPVAATYICVEITVDATSSPWGLVVKTGANCSSLSAATLGGWSCSAAGDTDFGASSRKFYIVGDHVNRLDGNIDHVRFEDQS